MNNDNIDVNIKEDIMDWKFVVGEVLIPLGTFFIGLFAGKNWDKYTKISAHSRIKGDKNTVIQNSRINGKKRK